MTFSGICDKEVPNKIAKRSASDLHDNKDVYEVYGNNGFLGFAHLEEKSLTPAEEKEHVLEEDLEDDEPIIIELNPENGMYKDVSKRSRYRDDFIRLSRSDVLAPPAGKRGAMWKFRGGKRSSGDDRLAKRKDTFIRLSRSIPEEPIEEPHKRIMWKFRAGKRTGHLSSGDIWYYFRARK